MSTRKGILRLFAALALTVGVFALDSARAASPSPDGASAMGEAVPDDLADASKAAFASGSQYFIWLDSPEAIVATQGDYQFIRIHFAIAPGVAPRAVTPLMQVAARDQAGQIRTVVMMGVGGAYLAVKNDEDMLLQGEGTAEIYLAAEGLDPGETPLSNVLKRQIRFE